MNKNKHPLSEMPPQHFPSLPRSSAGLPVGQEFGEVHPLVGPQSDDLAPFAPLVTDTNILTTTAAPTSLRFLRARRMLERLLLGCLAMVIAAAAGLGMVRPAHAKTIEVPCWPGTTFSLRSAIEEANNTPGHDEIVFTTKCTAFGAGVAGNYGHGAVGLPLITDELTIRGNGSTLKRESGDSYRFFESDVGVSLTLEDLIIEGGQENHGGAIWAGGPLTLTQVTMQNNQANVQGGKGGAVYAQGSLYISATTFLTNTAYTMGGSVYALGNVTVQGNSHFVANQSRIGGAIGALAVLYVSESNFTKNRASDEGGAIHADAPLTIVNSTFFKNNAGIQGGAILTNDTLEIVDSNFTGNWADDTGGAVAANHTTHVIGSTFEGNFTDDHNSTKAGGGAIYAANELKVQTSHFIDNRSEVQEGGAIYAEVPYEIESSTFNGNIGEYGGALYAAGTGIVRDSTFIGNKGYTGGGLYSLTSISVISSTFAANEAEQGGGLFAQGNAVISATTFSRNVATDDFFGGGGGALIISGQVLESMFLANTSAYGGGGLLMGMGVQIRGNFFMANEATAKGGAIAAYQVDSPSSLVANNLFIENNASQGSVIMVGVPNEPRTGGITSIIHNTIVRSQPGGSDAIYGATGVLNIQSNILTNYNVGVAAAASSTINADYNLIFGTSIPYSGASAGASDLFDDPLFADPKRRDFRLTPTSPAVDSAANPGIGDDFAKTPRPQGNGYDRGAFELIPVDEAISGLGVIHDGPTPLGSATRFSATVAAGENVLFLWDFGDGNRGEGANVVHTFAQTGTYTVSVIARNSVSQVSVETVVQVLPVDDGEPDDGEPDDDEPGGDNPDDDEPDDGNPDDGGPDDGEPDDGNPDDGSPDDGDPNDDNPDDNKPDDGNSDDSNPDDGNPDDGNPDDNDPNDGNPDDSNPDGGNPDDEPDQRVSLYLPLAAAGD